MLDSQTTLVLSALFFLVLPALVWWATPGLQAAPVAWWCAGSALAGTGIVLMAVRPWIPPLASFHGGNTCLLASMLLWSQSLRALQQRPWSLLLLAVWIALAALYYGVLHAGFDPDVRGMGMRAGLGLLSLYTAWMALRLARRLRSYNAGLIAAAYLLLALGLWAQLILHGGGGHQPNPFSRTWDASLIALTALVTAAVGHFCFTGMVLDTAARQQARAAAARAAAQETARLDAQMRQRDRRYRLTLVAGSLGHELNQPLAAALTQAQVAQRRLQSARVDARQLGDLLEKAGAGLERAADILDRIRASARARGLDLVRLDLRDVVRESVALLEDECRKLGVRLESLLAEQPLWSKGDEVALSQVLVNLVRNAMQVEGGAQPRLIEIRCAIAQGEVQVVVRDNGPGVPDEVLQRLGESFVSMRENGLGLGLAISLAIAGQHQGRLCLRNLPQGGTQATLSLPQMDRTPA